MDTKLNSAYFSMQKVSPSPIYICRREKLANFVSIKAEMELNYEPTLTSADSKHRWDFNTSGDSRQRLQPRELERGKQQVYYQGQ